MSEPHQLKLSPTTAAAARAEAQGIVSDVTGVRAVVVGTVDGFDIASEIRQGLDSARVAALASSIAAIGEVVSTEARLGLASSVTVTTESGFAVVYGVPRADLKLVIIVIAEGDAVLAQVNYRAATAARRLAAG